VTLDEQLRTILPDEPAGKEALIPLLQQVQGALGYVPEDAVYLISEKTGVPASEVFGVLTFYAQFRLKPRGRNMISVCLGTACHVLGAGKILDALQRHLDVEPGETTSDREFTLAEVRCLGSCSLAPVMVVNEDTYGRLTPDRAVKIVERYRNNGRDS
jgi:NADH-quinone oxidoreductase subunit E